MLNNLFYRLKQFYFGMTARYTPADEQFVRQALTGPEYGLFSQLPDFEKRHAVVVAQKMLQIAPPQYSRGKLAKLGLLHDIGKLAEKNSILSKSWLVIVRFFAPWLYNWLADGLKNKRYHTHKHHGAIGAAMLEKLGVSPDILAVISKHDPRVEPFGPDDSLELKILQAADSTY